MKTHDIEQLMAYADGELDAQTAKQVELELQDDPEGRSIVERFRQTRSQLAPGLDSLLDEPVPQRLIDAIRQHPGPPVTAAQPAPILPPARTASNDRWYWPSLATAASVALVVGLVGGQWLGSGASSGTDVLAQALQTVPSGQVFRTGTTQVMPLASFRSADGFVCREFEQAASGRAAHGIACLDGSQWVTRLLLDHGPADALGAAPPVYATASGEADAMSAMVEALKLGQAFTPQEEEQALRADWSAVR
jgi:negative regulator of sigma E activity